MTANSKYRVVLCYRRRATCPFCSKEVEITLDGDDFASKTECRHVVAFGDNDDCSGVEVTFKEDKPLLDAAPRLLKELKSALRELDKVWLGLENPTAAKWWNASKTRTRFVSAIAEAEGK